MLCLLVFLVPSLKGSKEISIVALLAALINSSLTYIPLWANLSTGWIIIIATLIAATIGALLFPKKEDE